MLKTKFEEIVDVNAIGGTNKKNFNQLMALTRHEVVRPSNDDHQKVLFVGIDFQNDFMENGELGVANSHKDVENTTRFIYKYLDKITTIALSLDTHHIHQIFHPSWWIDQDGSHPQPFTTITRIDVENDKWRAANHQKESLDYIINLERLGKKQLFIWPYHCIEGTHGVALEGQFSNMVHFHSIVRKSPIQKVVKGLDPLSEMYGIVKPEYSNIDRTNYGFLQSLQDYDKIIFAGEAKSHCVLESVNQIIEHYKEDRNLLSRMYLLEDCMSSISGFEETTEKACREIVKEYGIHIIKSTDLAL